MNVPENFKCLRCGACCMWEGPVRVSDAEIKEIAAHLSITEDEFISRYTCLAPDRKSLSIIEKPDGSCFFYDMEAKACVINDVKPEQCRNFPYKWNFSGWEKMCAGGQP